MIIQGIPSTQIISTIAAQNKDYELDFVNTESKNKYTLKVFLRRNENKYKIRLLYPELDMVWNFSNEEYELASRVYHRICDEVVNIKKEYDESMTSVSTIANKIRKRVESIAISKQEKY